MELSLSTEYFLNQIKDNKDKELFIKYYDNFQIHLEQARKYINIKKSLFLITEEFISNLKKELDLLTETDNKLEEELTHYIQLSNYINNSIKIIENDAMEYKEYFKKNLFYLIKK